MIKFLHMQSPDAAHIFCQSHPVVDMEELLMVIDEVMWDSGAEDQRADSGAHHPKRRLSYAQGGV